MAGICSAHRGLDLGCTICRSAFGPKGSTLTIYCVVDSYDETYTHNIDAAFLTEQEAKDFKEKRNFGWDQIIKLQVTL